MSDLKPTPREILSLLSKAVQRGDDGVSDLLGTLSFQELEATRDLLADLQIRADHALQNAAEPMWDLDVVE